MSVSCLHVVAMDRCVARVQQREGGICVQHRDSTPLYHHHHHYTTTTTTTMLWPPLQESEGEEAEASRVVLPSAAPGRAGRALAGRQSRVRLHEIGPRLELDIVKVRVQAFYSGMRWWSVMRVPCMSVSVYLSACLSISLIREALFRAACRDEQGLHGWHKQELIHCCLLSSDQHAHQHQSDTHGCKAALPLLMALHYLQVEEGMCDGAVLYHAHESRTRAEISAQRAVHEEAEKLRAARRRAQEDNVRRKQVCGVCGGGGQWVLGAIVRILSGMQGRAVQLLQALQHQLHIVAGTTNWYGRRRRCCCL